ncbi:MAG: hypothetical protein K5780_01900 [Alphaproteobacteria bacterium]|nr:hypothetical protein [Alphaproteobacteria bacterium]
MRKRKNMKIEEKEQKPSIFLRFFQKNSKKGSILLEIAVGISILAVISGFFIRKSMTANKYIREQLTKSNIETVAMSVASFVANNKRLPRPSETNDGVESSSLDVKFGYVPYKTLGISATIAKDGNLQPLVYMVESDLTANYSQIYEDTFESRVFCSYVFSPKIYVQENSNRENFDSSNSNNDVIAFAIDTKDHKNSLGETIILHPTAHTFWVTRDVLLMKYLKNSPCAIENPQQNSNRRLQEFDDDF